MVSFQGYSLGRGGQICHFLVYEKHINSDSCHLTLWSFQVDVKLLLHRQIYTLLILIQRVDVCISNSQGTIQDSYGPKYQWDFRQLMHHYFVWPQGIRNGGPKNLCQLAFPHLMREPNYYHNVPFFFHLQLMFAISIWHPMCLESIIF